ncbi:PHP domain-containing protein [Lachnospiraceae bacterium JLR.KK008]
MKDFRREYPYLYETHLHTREASACAKAGGADMVKACKAAGYTGIFITDHNWGGNTAVSRRLPWEDFIGQFVKGYEAARRMGEQIGLDVFFGWEAGYRGTEFLIYGLSPEWMLAHPQLWTASVEEQYALVHEGGGLVIHAHPFRKEYYIPQVRLFPEAVDGVEGLNATHSNSRSLEHNDRTFDEEAIVYAREHDLPMTAGSDIHRTALLGGGMAFRRKLKDAQDFVQAVKNREDYLLTNGEEWFDRDGRKLI